ncbi:MAG: hypothetical protein EOO77_23050, partial [Oxalobacteraceae bacterium]
YYDVSFEDYKAIEAANKSGLDLIDRSPKHYQTAKQSGENKATPARRMGSAIHAAVLEPLEFSNRYIVLEDGAPRRPTPAQISAKKPSPETIIACQYWDEFNARAEGKEVITAEDHKTCFAIADRLGRKPQANEFFLSGQPEVTLVWRKDGVLCKARADWVTEGAIVDLKSTENADEEPFLRDCWKYNYHRQAAWYLDGYRELTGEDVLFVIAAVEKADPFESNFFFMPEEAVHIGRLANDRAFERYRYALESGVWAGYPVDLIRADVPAWLMKKEGEHAE